MLDDFQNKIFLCGSDRRSGFGPHPVIAISECIEARDWPISSREPIEIDFTKIIPCPKDGDFLVPENLLCNQINFPKFIRPSSSADDYKRSADNRLS
jgi:hypothetical protein